MPLSISAPATVGRLLGDLIEFEIVPVVPSADTRQMIEPLL